MMTNLSVLSQNVLNELYFYWDSYDFQNWVENGLIPAELLEPSRVLELHNYLVTHRNILLRIPCETLDEV
jgi:hypothetical protein